MAIDELPPLRDVIAAHGLSARKALGQNFLLDLNLTAKIARNAGDLSGFDVLERLRAMPALTRLPIIMLTAHGREVEREKGLALGADDYITKPFSTQALVDKVKALLDESAA